MKAVGTPPTTDTPCAEDAAAQAFVRKRESEWSAEDEAALQARLSADAAFAEAYQQADAAWASIGAHAVSPELMRMREQALARARKAQARRWWPRRGHSTRPGLAVAALLVLVAGLAFQLSPYGYHPDDYRTAIGEQRVVALKDQSTIALDAAST
jgi:transmembrane sensor